ncbi:hypothetical protein [Leifsonia poae]|uniref:hypothetical protein n=1 Tax=Leifsonia poae TaxID=110933 RepID=UPI003D66AF69
MTAFWIPVLAIVSALGSLVMTIPASRLFYAKKIPLRKHWRLFAVQVAAGAAVALAILVLVHPFGSADRTSKVETAMSHSTGNHAMNRVIDRLRAHWPSAEIQVTLVPTDPNQLASVRVRVADHVFIEADHPGAQWAVTVFADRSGEAAPSNPGIRTRSVSTSG